MTDFKYTVAAFSVTMLISILYMSQLDDKLSWSPDQYMYMHHAQNILNHHPYSDTGFLFNKYNKLQSPSSYPPIFPLSLALIYKLYGPK